MSVAYWLSKIILYYSFTLNIFNMAYLLCAISLKGSSEQFTFNFRGLHILGKSCRLTTKPCLAISTQGNKNDLRSQNLKREAQLEVSRVH